MEPNSLEINLQLFLQSSNHKILFGTYPNNQLQAKHQKKKVKKMGGNLEK
jgi:hypothetical protein